MGFAHTGRDPRVRARGAYFLVAKNFENLAATLGAFVALASIQLAHISGGLPGRRSAHRNNGGPQRAQRPDLHQGPGERQGCAGERTRSRGRARVTVGAFWAE